MPKSNPVAVVAFGGNALVSGAERLSVQDQYSVVSQISKTIAGMAAAGWNVIVTHGNGPQVGFVMRRTELARNAIAPLSLDYAVANTQGVIGHMFVMSLMNEYRRLGLDRQALALVSQTLVDKTDPAFANPTKPIGSWYSEDKARELAAQNGWIIVEDAGRGWRRVVPSPRPVGIVQMQAIRELTAAGNLTLVVMGGGGIPVARKANGDLEGVEAVIDKDFVSSLLARELGADLLIFPTAVEKVAIGFNTPSQQWLGRLTLTEAEAYCQQGEFPKGSMEPKIRALMEFVDATGNPGVITNNANLEKALTGETGTRLIR